MGIWNDYNMKKESFEGRELFVIEPDVPNGKWALKTEYLGSFPEVEIELLDLGYHIFHVTNTTRWHKWEDTHTRARLAEYVNSKYGLSKKCVIIGMSCGGMQGIYFAAAYPEYVSCMYLDAPVVNLLSCPGGLGRAVANEDFINEFTKDKNMSFTELLSYRDHPLDYIPNLTEKNIPIIIVSGDSDTVVPFVENGKLLKDAYEKADCIIETIIKPGGDHHPHCLEDNSAIIEFIRRYDK